ncbi:hypothetical protein FOG51_00481 [Hanseniaspora uvarum]|uniref:Ribosome biogenesis protein RLP7 n=1 Tax=Hanseniaspora uvarum TaxID=29833 RepID=A0A1E5RJ54_HANUV|nr:hypothetical protein FOG48_00746 [Hanseniaspora uvarum]KAF0274562.1 hypothetical protein FOG51_00481 [Hanseniaspora uvarum]KAF0275464.1 hypothetical protein FOG50_03698 [Hanseniaspora uvarum]KKA02758.1 Ribosome biogenesis protein HuRLP7 [Hanseniaspora uvarum DSM 2768]OEJ86917.1 Ribosome biogenesis protein RLP7 [Hanseniaspora uvarum]
MAPINKPVTTRVNGIVMETNPEILLKKRRRAEETRLEKQQQAAKKIQKQAKQKANKQAKGKFIRAETIVATTLATEREKERIKRINKVEHLKSQNKTDHLASTVDYFLKVTENPDYDEESDEADNEELLQEKIKYSGEESLLFVLRIKGPVSVKIPHKPFTVLQLLRLEELNTGVFLKLNDKTFPLLKIIAPYVVCGHPSLKSIRSLIQKRSTVIHKKDNIEGEDEEEEKEVILNDNNIVEDKLGEYGIVCIDDIIHEISTLSEYFSPCNFFLQPFKLSREVSGFGAISKLRKLESKKKMQGLLSGLSNSGTAPVIQVDIDAFIEKLN